MGSSKDFGIIIEKARIPYTITDSKKAKYIRLIIDNEGLTVVKPYRAKIEEVEKLLSAKGKWIHKHYSRLQNNITNETKWSRESGNQVLYCGERYNIVVGFHQKNNICVTLSEGGFCVNMSDKLNDDQAGPLITEAFRKWYIKIARETYRQRIDYFSKIIGLSYKNFKIKEQKTRWGSCSAKGNLNFNWKIIMAPPCILDYVVVHELCHLKYMNHSKNFWSMVERYIPDYKKASDWLKKNGMQLKL